MSRIDSSIQIGNLTLKNRIVMPPIATYQSTEDGKVTDQMLEYYGARAKGGNIGLIITEHSYITLQGKAKARQLSVSDDSDIEGLKRLTEVIRQDGTRVFAQLNHAGSAAFSKTTGMTVVAPSSVILPTVPPMGDASIPEELTETEIGQITECFAKAALRAKKAGYDGVEIHSAHAYLLNEFYSPLTNLRKDAYGGDLEHRLRIHREVIRAVRWAVGTDYPVAIRLGGCDYMEGGSTIDDCVQAACVFEEEGVDLIDLSGGMCRYTRPGHEEPGYFQDMSAAVKAAVHVPVLLTGGVKTGSAAQHLLEQEAADLIGVGRALLKNPNWADEVFGTFVTSY